MIMRDYSGYYRPQRLNAQCGHLPEDYARKRINDRFTMQINGLLSLWQ
jgi:hypothetical protein